jgi:RNA polymerase sigma factor (sigma-70 family)
MSGLMDVSAETLTGALNGDQRAVATLVRALERPFYNLALRMLMCPSDAEEATQEALLRVLTHLSEFRGESRFSTWAYRVAVHRILDEKRARARRHEMTFDEHAADLANGLRADAEERAEDAVLLTQVKLGCGRALLQCLDADHRLAYVLGEILELASDEAALIAEIPAPTFRKRLSRARQRIGDALSDRCGIVNVENACRCHRRLDRAKELGRVDAGALIEPLDLVKVRRAVQEVEALQRAAAYFRADPEAPAPTDYVARLRELVASSSLS